MRERLRLLLSKKKRKNQQKPPPPPPKKQAEQQQQHTVSFDWFLCGLDRILNSRVLFIKTVDILPEIIMGYQI